MERINVNDPKVLYHFTCSVNLSAIMQTGFINLTASNYSIDDLSLFPVVWLTSSPTPNNHGLSFNEKMPVELNKTRIRFTIRNRPFIKQWDLWCEEKGMDRKTKQAMIETAFAENTYMNWYISEQPISIADDAICVENLETGQIREF